MSDLNTIPDEALSLLNPSEDRDKPYGPDSSYSVILGIKAIYPKIS
tara:strand:- start:45 stop:182 length:138 start_codon:yes stop_codon:yes gene_type:complete